MLPAACSATWSRSTSWSTTSTTRSPGAPGAGSESARVRPRSACRSTPARPRHATTCATRCRLVNEITDAVERARRAVDLPPPARLYCGPCPDCGADLYARPDRVTVGCRECESRHDVESLRAALLDAVTPSSPPLPKSPAPCRPGLGAVARQHGARWSTCLATWSPTPTAPACGSCTPRARPATTSPARSGRSSSTVTGIARELGLSFDHSKTAAATAARQIDNRTRRTEIVGRLYGRARTRPCRSPGTRTTTKPPRPSWKD